jgi:hypothetical protein
MIALEILNWFWKAGIASISCFFNSTETGLIKKEEKNFSR